MALNGVLVSGQRKKDGLTKVTICFSEPKRIGRLVFNRSAFKFDHWLRGEGISIGSSTSQLPRAKKLVFLRGTKHLAKIVNLRDVKNKNRTKSIGGKLLTHDQHEPTSPATSGLPARSTGSNSSIVARNSRDGLKIVEIKSEKVPASRGKEKTSKLKTADKSTQTDPPMLAIEWRKSSDSSNKMTNNKSEILADKKKEEINLNIKKEDSRSRSPSSSSSSSSSTPPPPPPPPPPRPAHTGFFSRLFWS